MVFWTLVVLVASVVLSELLRPKPNIEDARPAGLGDFDFPTATEDRVVPIVFGRVLLKGPNVVWYGDLDQEAIVKKTKTGFFSSTKTTIGFRYRIGIQFALCRGPDVALRQVRIGEVEAFSGNLVGEGRFDVDDLDFLGGDEFGAGGIQTTCDFFPGTKTQAVSIYLDTAARQRITTAATPTAPRYTGTCHVVARELTSVAALASNRGAYVGNSTTIKPWEFEVERFPGLFDGQSAGQNLIGTEGDCNPMNVIYEILTNTEYGFSAVDAEIDLGVGSTFVAASNTLITEGNGFAMAVTKIFDADKLIVEIQRQIDGVVFIHPTTGKWTVQLTRGPDDPNFGYDVDTVQQFNDDTIVELKEFTRGTWEDTTNQVQVRYFKRVDDYKGSFAPAQNMANGILLAGGAITAPRGSPSIVDYPGVKTSALAVNLAWRDLDAQSRPLLRATFVVNRENYALVIGGVAAWTDARRGFTKQAMRVLRIDYGTLLDNKMTVLTIEDIFFFAPASYGDPPATAWVPPTTSLVAFPSAEQLAFEAPRGLVVRDPEFAGDAGVAKVFASARRQGGEVAFEIGQRNASGTPAGSFALAGDVVAFMRIGELTSALDAGTAIPTAIITVTPTPDVQAAIEAVFDDASTPQDLGVDLVQMILVGTEFMLVTSAANNASNVDLQTVYRGALDSVQENHLAGADVFLIFVGAGLTDTNFPNTNNVDVELRMRSSSSVFGGAVTVVGFTLARRALRPYAPSSVLYNGSASIFGVPDLEGDGSGLNGVGFDVDWRRRRFDTVDEAQELLADQAVSASTEHRVQVFVDPSGGNTLVFDSGWVSGSGPVTPTQALVIVPAAAGTEIRTRIDSRHDILGEVDLQSRNSMTHDVVPTSVRTAQFYLGGDLQATQISNTYVVTSATAHNVTIGGAYSTSVVQVSINGAGFTTIIAAGLTTGATAVLAINDTIRLRHTTNETPDPNFVEIDDGTSDVAYGAFSA